MNPQIRISPELSHLAFCVADLDFRKRISRGPDRDLIEIMEGFMSITAIPSVLAPVSNATATAVNPPANPAPPPQQPAATDAEDTVQLTEAQRVYQLYNQGQPVSQIALTLSLPLAAVNSYLNLTTTGG
jgi:hypothetical protein